MPASLAMSLDQVQERLRSLEAELQHNDRLATLGSMAAGVAHEVNNQLTPALAYAQMLQAGHVDPAFQAKAVERIVSGIATAGRILETMLGFARPGDVAGSVRIEDAAESAILLCHKDLARSRIELDIDVPSDLEVGMSPIALQQVFVNLLVNARRALAEQGSGRIEIAAREGEGGIVVEVSDDGPGIPDAIRARLFEPFVHGGNGDSHGLGLSMCRRLVEAAGGAIEVEHPECGGALFRLRLPSALSDRPDDARPLATR